MVSLQDARDALIEAIKENADASKSEGLSAENALDYAKAAHELAEGLQLLGGLEG